MSKISRWSALLLAAVRDVGAATESPQGLVETLASIYDAGPDFDVRRGDMPAGADWGQIVGELKKSPDVDCAYDPRQSGEDGLPWSVHVRIKPLVWVKMREKPRREVRCQIKIGKAKVDLRNQANYDLVVAKVPDLETVTGSYLTQLQSGPTKRQRRAILCQLLRILLLRGSDLNPWLRGQVCLWTKAPLPADYFKTPLPPGLQAKAPMLDAQGKLIGFGPPLNPQKEALCA